MTGYDFQTKNSSPTYSICSICNLLIRDHTELPCSHSYCNECLTSWEEEHASGEDENKQSEK